MSMIHLEKENFNELIKGKVVLVDFYADWCGPCKMLAPVLEDFASEQPDITVIKVNVDEFQELAGEYSVMSIPTLITFKEGVQYSKRLGFQSKDMLLNFVNENK